jgi:hypothetical protein
VADRWRSSGRGAAAANSGRPSSGRRRGSPGDGGDLRAGRERGGRPAASRDSGEANGRCGRRSERRRWYFAVGGVKRTEKKRAERMGVRWYWLARRQDLWRRARCHDDCHVTECYLGATAYGAELRVQTCKLNFWGSKRKFLSLKGLKNKKFGTFACLLALGIVQVCYRALGGGSSRLCIRVPGEGGAARHVGLRCGRGCASSEHLALAAIVVESFFFLSVQGRFKNRAKYNLI